MTFKLWLSDKLLRFATLLTHIAQRLTNSVQSELLREKRER